MATSFLDTRGFASDMRLAFLTLAAAGLSGVALVNANSNEVLYNGIQLPQEWPPQVEQLSREPMRVPYLEKPPSVIPIDVGRQLFVDDFLIESTSLRRTFHHAKYHPANPVLRPDRPWEQEQHGLRQGPVAMPFSDGVWYDPQDKLFKMWYLADYGKDYVCYATSQDGVRWEKPSLDVVVGTNIVFKTADSDARVVWLDLNETDPARRFKLFITQITRGEEGIVGTGQDWHGKIAVHFSPDGIHWSKPVAYSGKTKERNTVFFNPFRNVWVFSLREFMPAVGSKTPERARRYWESTNLVTDLPYQSNTPTMWVGADRLDKFGKNKNLPPELYNLDAVAYESLVVGLFSIHRDYADVEKMRPKINEICVGFSRDGFHWHRPDRHSFLPVSEESQAWNWGNVQSAGGCFLVVGEELYFYVSGRKGDAPHFHDAGGSTGLAILRRDGFASMDAADGNGELKTRPIVFEGNHLFVNVDANGGELRAEVLDSQGKVVEPFTLANCIPVDADTTCAEVRWKGIEDLSSVAGAPIHFRFTLRDGSLFAFWTSPDKSGASHGYVAAGGPRFTGSTDTVGQ